MFSNAQNSVPRPAPPGGTLLCPAPAHPLLPAQAAPHMMEWVLTKDGTLFACQLVERLVGARWGCSTATCPPLPAPGHRRPPLPPSMPFARGGGGTCGGGDNWSWCMVVKAGMLPVPLDEATACCSPAMPVVSHRYHHHHHHGPFPCSPTSRRSPPPATLPRRPRRWARSAASFAQTTACSCRRGAGSAGQWGAAPGVGRALGGGVGVVSGWVGWG